MWYSTFMKPSKPRPEYETLVQRIAAGELSREQAAAESENLTGLKGGTFLSWLRTSGATQKLKPVRRNAGVNSPFAHTDPDKIKAYEDAMALASSGRVSVRAAALRHGVSYPYLLRKFHKANPPDMEQTAQKVERLVKALATDPVKRTALIAALSAIPK